MSNENKNNDIYNANNDEMKLAGVVMKTYDYERFKTLKGNRDVNEKHVQSIIKSMKKKGILMTPILVNEDMEIIDGQHRFQALKELGQPIFFMKVDGYGIKECQAYNAVMRKWTARDFIDGYSNEGNENYRILGEFCKKYNFINMEMALALLSGTIDSKHSSSKEAKIGNFIVRDYELGCKLAEQIKYLLDLMPNSAKIRFYKLHRALRKIMLNKDYDHQRMIDKFTNVAGSFRNCMSVDDYVVYFEGVYNRNMKKNIIRF